MTWELRVTDAGHGKWEFMNCVRSNAIEEMLTFLANREIPFDSSRSTHTGIDRP